MLRLIDHVDVYRSLLVEDNGNLAQFRIDLALCWIRYSELVPAGHLDILAWRNMVLTVVPCASTLIVTWALPFNKSRGPKLRFSLKTELKS
jgi:hypothetical protein